MHPLRITVLLVVISLAQPLHNTVAEGPNIFVVNSTGDEADASTDDDQCDVDLSTEGLQCTLRAAIDQANFSPNKGGPDEVHFDIPTANNPNCVVATGVCRIGSQQGWSVVQPVLIDGYTQPGAQPNSNTFSAGSNAVLKVVLDGVNAFAGFGGLTLNPQTPGNTTVRGLVIHRYSNNGLGIQINGSGVRIEGNFIGTDATGTLALENSIGVRVIGSGNTIGGLAPRARNVISGNNNGLQHYVSGATGNTILGNYIGTNASATEALANNLNGISIYLASGNTIGGEADGAGNLISGNGLDGIVVLGNSGMPATGNVIQGNYIGTEADGVGALGNAGRGIALFDWANNSSIGGAATGAGNTIAFNGSNGIRVEGANATGNLIRANSIHSNGVSPAIKGIDTVSGGNTELAPPVITDVGSASGTACPHCEVDVFSDSVDEGRIYDGTAEADATGNWSFPGIVSGPKITATATDSVGNTSGFSQPFDATNLDSDGDGYTNSRETDLSEDAGLYCPIMRADVGGDGSVSILDLSAVASAFGQSVPSVPARLDQGLPADRDGLISILDLAAVARHFGKLVSACP